MKKLKKLLSVLLAATMVMTMGACGNSEPGSSEADTSESVATESVATESTEVAEDIDPYWGKFEEPVTIRVAKPSADEPGTWTWEDNEWTREWKERFNIEIELMWNTGTDEEYNTKFAMSMLTGDLPDVFQCNYEQFMELYNEGYLADITDVVENNVYPYLKETWAAGYNEDIEASTIIDGRKYAIAGTILGTNTRTIMIRRDYREAVGAEIPTTMEEVIELGKKFVDEGLCKYAFVLSDKVTGSGYTDMQAVANAYGAYPNLWVEDENGDLVYSPTTEGMKKTLDVYKELFDNGYINSTFATDVSDNITAYVSNGEVGIMPSDFWVATWPLPLTDENGDVIEFDMIPVVASETNNDFHVQGTNSLADVSYICVNAECEDPAAVMRIFNHTCAMINDPELAQTDVWHTVKNEDGTETSVFMRNPSPINQFTIPHINMLTAVAIVEAQNGNMEMLAEQPHYQQQYDAVVAYKEAVESGDKEAIKAGWGNNKLFDGEDSIFYNFYKNYSAGNYIWDARTMKTENYERLWGTLQQYENTFYVNYICGTEDTTFEEFVDEWYAMGGQLLTDELNAE